MPKFIYYFINRGVHTLFSKIKLDSCTKKIIDQPTETKFGPTILTSQVDQELSKEENDLLNRLSVRVVIKFNHRISTKTLKICEYTITNISYSRNQAFLFQKPTSFKLAFATNQNYSIRLISGE